MRLRRRLKRLKRIVRRPFEWLGIFLALAFFAVLPRRAMLAVCDFASAGNRYEMRNRLCLWMPMPAADPAR